MGNLLSSPVTKKETHTGVTPCGIEYGVSSMQGWRVHMEDAHICEPHLYAQAPQRSEEPAVKIDLEGHSLFAVFDGHGGTFAAFYAGANLCRVLSRQHKFVAYAKFVKERPEKEPTLEGTAERIKYIQSGLGLLEGALRDAFVEIDREIFLASMGRPVPEANQSYHENGHDPAPGGPQPPNEDSGSTAIAVVVTPFWVVCANAGDSRSVLSRQGNKACPLSYDHKPDDYDEEKRIKAAGGYVAEGRVGGDLAVSRGLGDYRFKDAETVMMGNDFAAAPPSDSQQPMLAPEQMKVTACPDIIIRNRNPETDEFIIVACDGIWDVQSNQQFVTVVADILREGESNIGLVCEEVRVTLCAYRAFDS
jgi:serine/threonine protein phosphatase PrpC